MLHFFMTIFFLCCVGTGLLPALTENEIGAYQQTISHKTLPERIALWAEKFVGVPYDPDPLGEYVTKKVIVADDRVDCMYLSFRAVELALGRNPDEALTIALDKRFRTQGALSEGIVVNYDDRFAYGEDMLDSGKWGREITEQIGPVTVIAGSRGREKVSIISRGDLLKVLSRHGTARIFEDGDLVFFIKSPGQRVADEIVGHIGIIKRQGNEPYLIHAGGKKHYGGTVQKVLFSDYVSSMPFAGVRVSRFLNP